MEMTFYDGGQFPAENRGDVFAAFHGSWNRSRRTGYKVVHIFLRNDQPTGEYEDFLTGFVINDSDVWGRPVGVAVAQDGSLMVSEDGNGSIWRSSDRNFWNMASRVSSSGSTSVTSGSLLSPFSLFLSADLVAPSRAITKFIISFIFPVRR